MFHFQFELFDFLTTFSALHLWPLVFDFQFEHFYFLATFSALHLWLLVFHFEFVFSVFLEKYVVVSPFELLFLILSFFPSFSYNTLVSLSTLLAVVPQFLWLFSLSLSLLCCNLISRADDGIFCTSLNSVDELPCKE